jgi:hypothetical protein
VPKALLFLFTLLLLISCGKDNKAEPFDEKLSQPFIDPRNGKQYKTVKTGNIVWMADNLDYDSGDSLSWCYKGDCEKYGRLYNWEKAMNVCPSGWHLPNVREWKDFDMAVFLLPDSYCEGSAFFDKYLFQGWWTSTSAEKGTYIYDPGMKGYIDIYPDSDMKIDLSRMGCTVRCIQDNPHITPFAWDSATIVNFSLDAPLQLPSDSASDKKLAYKKYVNYVDSLLEAKYKTKTNWCKTVEQDTSEISRFAKKDTSIKNIIASNFNTLCVKPAEITTYWLNSKIKEYERQFSKPVPECRQCSDLELLLMLEDAIKANVAELNIAAKAEDSALKTELKKTQADYERKFKIRAPWWYICSDKEHLERLQKAIETNKPELDYSYGYQMMNYRIGKLLALYEMRFKKQAPNWDESECTDKERFERLVKAIKTNKPYLTEEEKKNRHSFHFRYKDYSGTYASMSISVNKTSTGAIIKYQLPVLEKESADTLEANLSAEEWLDFTNTLQKLGVTGWNKSYIKNAKKWRGGKEWEVEIFLPGNLDSAQFSSYGLYTYPPNWDEFMELMNGIKKKTAQELESKLKAEYEKRFKKPITEQELSTEKVSFSLELSNKTPINSTSLIIITRTANGATAHYSYGPKDGVKISTEEWLDFINALYKSSFMEWDEEYGKERAQALFNDIYKLGIYNSNYVKPRSFFGANKYPPNWGKFIKAINDIRAKAKKDSVTKEVEGKLKIEYKKRFGKPISDLELSAKSMEFSVFSKKIDNAVLIRLNRTATGALIEYNVEGSLLNEELSMEEWLDFLNNLQKCPGDGKWGFDLCCRKNVKDYSILNPNYDFWGLGIKSSGDADEFNRLYARDICTPKWDEFVKILSPSINRRF